MPLGADENFFENGMNSVSGALFVSRCRKEQARSRSLLSPSCYKRVPRVEPSRAGEPRRRSHCHDRTAAPPLPTAQPLRALL